MIHDDLQVIFQQTLAHQVPAVQAEDLATQLVHALHTHFGGCQIYFPKPGAAATRAERNQRIVAEFNGNNHADLALRHHLTVAQIYRILRR